jgi:purine-binding chemotaxis protein CheW
MRKRSFLIVGIDNYRYAISSNRVLDIINIPLLQPTDRLDIIGTFNWHGEEMPITTLGLLVEKKCSRREIGAQVAVLKTDAGNVSLLCDRIFEVTEPIAPTSPLLVPPTQIVPLPSIWIDGTIATAEETILPTLNLKMLEGILHSPAAASGDFVHWQDDLDVAQLAILQQRATIIAAPREKVALASLNLGIARIANINFALALDYISAFIPFPKVYPIPGCPEFVLGHTNWRGQIVTVFDLAIALELVEPKTRLPYQQVAIVSIDDITIGIPLESVPGLIDFPTENMSPRPADFDARIAPFVLGVGRHENTIFYLLHMAKLITSNTLIVDVVATPT